MSAKTERDATLRFLKILYWTLVGAGAAYVYLTYTLVNQPGQNSPDFEFMRIALAIVAVMEGAIPLATRFYWIPKLLDAPPDESRSRPVDFSSRIGRLRFAYLLSFVMMEVILNMGLIAGFISGNFWEGVPYFIVGFLLFAVSFPRLPSVPHDPMSGPIG